MSDKTRDSSEVYRTACEEVVPQQIEHTLLLCRIAQYNPQNEEAQKRARDALLLHNRVEELPDLGQDPYCISSPDINLHQEETENAVGTSRLPTELYFNIIRQVENLNASDRQKTLVALASSNTTLRSIVQPYIWAEPRDLENVQRQLRFRYALALDSNLASTVKSLRMVWLPYGINGQLVLDIIKACPHIEELLLQRGDNDFENAEDMISEKDAEVFSCICEHLPKIRSFYFFGLTTLNFSPSNDLHKRCSPFFSRLQHLHLAGQGSDWLLDACLGALSPSLESLHFGMDVFLDSPDALESIGKSCPHIKLLDIGSRCCCADDIVRFSHQTHGLRILRIQGILEPEEVIEREWPNPAMYTTWLAEALLQWSQLQELDLGSASFVSIEALRALAFVSAPSLSKISLAYLDDEADDLEAVVAACVKQHSNSLTSLDLEWGQFPAGAQTLQACSLASQLRSLNISVGADKGANSSHIDALLTACPNLSYISSSLLSLSSFQHKWIQRLRVAEEQAHKKRDQEISTRFLGT